VKIELSSAAGSTFKLCADLPRIATFGCSNA